MHKLYTNKATIAQRSDGTPLRVIQLCKLFLYVYVDLGSKCRKILDHVVLFLTKIGTGKEHSPFKESL